MAHVAPLASPLSRPEPSQFQNEAPSSPASNEEHPRGRSRALTIVLAVCASSWVASNGGPVAAAASFAEVPATVRVQLILCLGTLAGGLVLYYLCKENSTIQSGGILLVYFGAQTGMNLYMKNILSNIIVDEEERMFGVPMGFLVTSIQQFVSFITFMCFFMISKLFGSEHRVKRLHGFTDYVAVLMFSMSFAFNIGLNNFSLTLVAISISLIVRSCLPLATALSQTVVGTIVGQSTAKIPMIQWVLMIGGVGCTVLATHANTAWRSSDESAALVLGVTCLVASLFAGALNLVLAGVLGTGLKLNPMDTLCYMSLPAGVALLFPALFVSHPVGDWTGFGHMTDWEVFLEVMKRKPDVMVPVCLSGVLSFIYNSLQYSLVHKLSAAHMTFAGNFNKAALVAMSLALGLETLPPGGYGGVFLIAVIGNISFFALYSAVKAKREDRAIREVHVLQVAEPPAGGCQELADRGLLKC